MTVGIRKDPFKFDEIIIYLQGNDLFLNLCKKLSANLRKRQENY